MQIESVFDIIWKYTSLIEAFLLDTLPKINEHPKAKIVSVEYLANFKPAVGH